MLDLPNLYYCVLMTFTYSWFCFQMENEDTEENSEDASQSDPGENTAGE